MSYAVGIGREVLVVDDNELNLVAIEAALEATGRPLVFAQSGTEALRLLLERDFALILLDVAMPNLDGFETAELIRRRERNRTTPIIFITGIAWENESILRGYDLGAFDYLLKPIRPEVLRAKARVFVELQERTLELQQSQASAHRLELESQRRHLEANALERQLRQLHEIGRHKDELLEILARELHDPLQPLLSGIDLAERTPGEWPPATRTRLREQVARLDRLVGELLDMARLSFHVVELAREHVSIDEVLDEVIQQCRTLLDHKRHHLGVRYAGAAGVIEADRSRLVQVFVHLITNAAQYTPPGGHIDVQAAVQGDQVVVRVVDDGRGISARALPHVFEMFVQERSDRENDGGLGLGLARVKSLVELHRGSVLAASEGHGRGSTFEVRLPRATGSVGRIS